MLGLDFEVSRRPSWSSTSGCWAKGTPGPLPTVRRASVTALGRDGPGIPRDPGDGPPSGLSPRRRAAGRARRVLSGVASTLSTPLRPTIDGTDKHTSPRSPGSSSEANRPAAPGSRPSGSPPAPLAVAQPDGVVGRPFACDDLVGRAFPTRTKISVRSAPRSAGPGRPHRLLRHVGDPALLSTTAFRCPRAPRRCRRGRSAPRRCTPPRDQVPEPRAVQHRARSPAPAARGRPEIFSVTYVITSTGLVTSSQQRVRREPDERGTSLRHIRVRPGQFPPGLPAFCLAPAVTTTTSASLQIPRCPRALDRRPWARTASHG